MKPNSLDDFWKKVDKDLRNPCWIWLAAKDLEGYGFFWFKNKQVRSHRFSWEITHGKIPNGLFVCHHCDNPSCVRPDHLFLGTCQDNALDMISKGRGTTGRKMDPEVVAKSAAARIGLKRTPEFCERMRQLSTGKTLSEETRVKMSLAHLGSVRSEGAKQRTADKHRGMKRSDEARVNMVLAWRRRKQRAMLKQESLFG